MIGVRVETQLFYIRIEGEFNPATLNHDFLLKIGAIPDDAEVPEPTVIPVMASLDYKGRGLKIVADLDQFMVWHKADVPEPKQAISLAKSYLKTLEHTPVKSVSFNFHGQALFPTVEGVASFEAWLLRDKTALMSNLHTDRLRVTVQLSYDFDDFEATARLGPIDVKEASLRFLLCYEKKISDARGIVSLLGDESRISRIMEASVLHLRGFCVGGIINA